MNKQLTEIVLLLDRSRSMARMEEDTIGEFNVLVKKAERTWWRNEAVSCALW